MAISMTEAAARHIRRSLDLQAHHVATRRGADHAGADSHKLPVQVERALRERCYGGFEGLLYAEIEQLAGCDRLTISPDLLEKLALDEGKLERKLAPGNQGEPRLSLNEAQFRWASNEDAMATEKLAEGIRQFARDQEKLEALLSGK